MPFNKLFSWIIKKRVHQIELFKEHPIDVQRDVFQELIQSAFLTEFGKQHRFRDISEFKDFQKAVPLQTYDDLKPYVDRLKEGEQNLLWPTEINWFAKSSGTTSNKSKLIPVSRESLESCHYKGGKDLLGMYYTSHPKTKLFSGKHLIIGGSSRINHINRDSYFGDLSAIIIKNLPWWCEFRRTPSKETALLDQWEEKIERLSMETAKEDVHILAGVPSWTMVLIKRILEMHGTDNIFDIWPNLELFMHGGVSFEPYKDQYKKLLPRTSMNYVETYNASEGFFGIQDRTGADDMLLMLDYGIFYEFIPMAEFEKENPTVLTLADIELGTNYAIVISTNGGLWRYVIGDTIKFTSRYPYRIQITGRTTNYINAFGEELIVENANKAFTNACEKCNADLKEYTGAPIYMNLNSTGGHEWLVEFNRKPENLDYFIKTFDQELMAVNSDYEAKRVKSLIIQEPIIRIVPDGTFYEWLKSKGKLGGQYKIPRLSNNRDLIDEIKAHTAVHSNDRLIIPA